MCSAQQLPPVGQELCRLRVLRGRGPQKIEAFASRAALTQSHKQKVKHQGLIAQALWYHQPKLKLEWRSDATAPSASVATSTIPHDISK